MSAEALSLDIRLTRASFALDVTAEVPLTGVTAIFGPSGCGKTTLLRVVAGLEGEAEGRVAGFGETWQDETRFLPAHKRGIGYVFQDAALFEHLSVADNIRYGARRRGVAEARVAEVVEAMDLGALTGRMPAGLSGGERQRVALARSLLSNPRLLLLDEPMSALDEGRREGLLPYLQRSIEISGLPAIYVSHRASELRRMADRVFHMDGGKLRSDGGPGQLPGVAVLRFEGVLGGAAPDGCRAFTCDGAEGWIGRENRGAGPALVTVRSDRVVLARPGHGGVAAVGGLPVRVLGVAGSERKNEVIVTLEAGANRIDLRQDRDAVARLSPADGDALELLFLNADVRGA